MPSIYRPKGRKKYRITYVDPATGRPVTVPGYRDKKATEELARKLERDAARAAAGLPVVSRDSTKKPIAEITETYLAELARLGKREGTVHHNRLILARLWRDCRWRSLAEVRADGLTEFLRRLQAAGRSPRSLNNYLETLNRFCRWCVKHRHLPENPIAHVERSKEYTVRPRRAYTLEEFRAMLTTKRRDVYEVAGLSGFRWNELRQMEKRDLSPYADRPVWHLRPEITKAKRLDVIPILPDLLPTIRRLWDNCPLPTSRLFHQLPCNETWHKDQKRAGVTKHDALGRQADFHSFRYFFCTLLGRVLPIQKVKILMRHKNIAETADLYTDLGLQDVAEDLWKVPPIFSATAVSTSPPNAPEKSLE